jgi:hypothetical protein
MDELKHFRDPCVHCATPHDDVPSGPCQGDPTKAVPIRWRPLGVRWDGVERFLIQLSNGKFEERYEHGSMAQLVMDYLGTAPLDDTLRRRS